MPSSWGSPVRICLTGGKCRSRRAVCCVDDIQGACCRCVYKECLHHLSQPWNWHFFLHYMEARDDPRSPFGAYLLGTLFRSILLHPSLHPGTRAGCQLLKLLLG